MSRKNKTLTRLMQELKELQNDNSNEYKATPMGDDLYHWHFTIRGPRDSEFEGGIYHGRIILPINYPFAPPNIVMLTPSGRFKVDEKICLSISSFHPEHWQPAWSIRTALIALISFMPTPPEGAIGSMDAPREERIRLAKDSYNWKCQHCGMNGDCFPPVEEVEKNANEENQNNNSKESDMNGSENENDTTSNIDGTNNNMENGVGSELEKLTLGVTLKRETEFHESPRKHPENISRNEPSSASTDHNVNSHNINNGNVNTNNVNRNNQLSFNNNNSSSNNNYHPQNNQFNNNQNFAANNNGFSREHVTVHNQRNQHNRSHYNRFVDAAMLLLLSAIAALLYRKFFVQ